MLFRIPFRGFEDSELVVGYYPSGAMRMDLVNNGMWLAELTLDHVKKFEGCVCFKKTNYLEELLGQMLAMDIIDFYSPCKENDKIVYVAGVGKNVSPTLSAAWKQAAYAM